MKNFTAEQLAEIIQKHHAWLNDEDGGEQADLSSADLSYADLRSADLRYADLRSADLRSADLRSADLRSANLSSADLSYADLRSADLSYAASIWGAVGNLSQIKSVQCDLWPVTYTAERMQIGCQFHTLAEWWAFSDEEIQEMDSRASAWWSIWKSILKQIIEVSPALPCATEEAKVAEEA